jgi:protein TonB
MANPALNAGLPLMLGSGAASAPAPAREDQSRSAQVSLDIKATPGNVSDKAAKGSAESTSSTEATSALTFGGTNVPAESSSGHKKILIGVAAAAVIAVGLYFGWTQFKGHASTPVSSEKPVNTAPAVIPTAKKPSAAPPATTLTATTPTPSESLAISQPAAAPTKNPAADDTDADAGESTPASTSSSAKSSISTPSSGDKAGAAAKSAAAPLVVKGGAAPAIHSKTEASADTPAPSMIGLATPGSDAPPDLVGDTGNAPQPVLQTLNISQGVSQGLLIKKVQPAYPKMALTMRIEGTVELMTTISKTGDITHVKVLSGDPQLTKAAVDAVKQWKYKPYLLNGEPVEIQTQITINFKLPS